MTEVKIRQIKRVYDKNGNFAAVARICGVSTETVKKYVDRKPEHTVDRSLAPDAILKARLLIKQGVPVWRAAEVCETSPSTIQRYTADIRALQRAGAFPKPVSAEEALNEYSDLPTEDMQAEQLASRFYAAFESAARKHKQAVSGIPWVDLPSERRAILIDACKEVLEWGGVDA